MLIISLGYLEESQNAGSSTLKRTKHSHTLPPQFLHIHQVDCNEIGIHAGHGTVSYFLDRPRLFAGDCKASPLRGMMAAHITQDYLDDHPKLSFIIYESYNCNEYHELLKNDFERIQMPHIDKLALIQLRPYLFILKSNGCYSSPKTQVIKGVSETLAKAISEANALFLGDLNYLVTTTNWSAPYLELYHTRMLLDRLEYSTTLKLSATAKLELSLLYGVVRNICIKDWAEADTLFKRGVVSKGHLSKLFGPRQIVVQIVDSVPMAYFLENNVVSQADNSIVMSCVSWKFEKVFTKRTELITIHWIHGDKEIPITELKIYPLQYDTSGLESKLRERGEIFWRCRQEAFMSYEPPKQTFDNAQTVSSRRRNFRYGTLSTDIQQAHSRFMIDNATYKAMHQESSNISPESDDLGREAFNSDRPPPEPFLLLLPAKIRGYGLKDKKWSESLSCDKQF